jgi:hypothetical protein
VSHEDDRSKRRLRKTRKRLLSLIPFMRRGRHERILARMRRHFDSMQKYIDRERDMKLRLAALFLAPPPPATSASCTVRVPFKSTPTDELCLFVTHAPSAALKPHVVDHMNALMDLGVAVVLIANTDCELTSLDVPPELAVRLHGCLVRQNLGFDFAAWAHAYLQLDATTIRRRLYLVNDSIIGPLDRAAYDALIARVRMADADLVGLTANPDPQPHLQSFFLVFNERLLHSPICHGFFERIVNMPEKQDVIDCYEVWLTSFLQQRGFRWTAIFPSLSKLTHHRRNDTVHAWRGLLEAGFPFIKSMVVRDPLEGAEARALLPDRYL